VSNGTLNLAQPTNQLVVWRFFENFVRYFCTELLLLEWADCWKICKKTWYRNGAHSSLCLLCRV